MDPHFEVVPIAEAAAPADFEKDRPVVLVVDDEETIADTLTIILSRSGFAAISAYDGEEALEIARTIPPHFLLSDVKMPGMSGVELAIAVTKRVDDCRVLLLSGRSSSMDLVADARGAGYNFETLTKPVHPEYLIGCIRRSLSAPASDFARARFEESDWGMPLLGFSFGK